MARQKTANLPDLRALVEPAGEFVGDIQRVLLRCGKVDLPSLSIAEQIAARLAAMIVLDQLQPGQRIIEEEICAVLGVSRAPIREALRILERDRLIVIIARKGAYVSTYSPKELADIFEIRASLITLSYEHMLLKYPEAFIAQLRSGVAGLEQAARSGTRDDYTLASFRLTTGLRSLCDNKLLFDMVQSLALQMLRYSRLGFGAEHGIERSLRDWNIIAKAVARHDIDKATTTLRRRLRGSRDAALSALEGGTKAPALAIQPPRHKTDASPRTEHAPA